MSRILKRKVLIFPRKAQNHEPKFHCYCVNYDKCPGMNQTKQLKRKTLFLTQENYGGYLPVFCPFLETTIFKLASEQEPDKRDNILEFDGNGKPTWNHEILEIYCKPIKDAMLHNEKPVLPTEIVKFKNFLNHR